MSTCDYLLDTDTCIYALKGTYPKLEESFRERSPSDIAIPAIVKAELLLGAEKSNRPRETSKKVSEFCLPFDTVPFGEQEANKYAEIRANLEQAGRVIGPNDLLIAATALSLDVVLVSHNVEEFGRITALTIQDWTQ
jgi:tRNA(fMet)-specific endonuclease VapC